MPLMYYLKYVSLTKEQITKDHQLITKPQVVTSKYKSFLKTGVHDTYKLPNEFTDNAD